MKSKTMTAVALMAVVLAGCSMDRDSETTFGVEASLSGASEVPPVATAASGTVSATLEGDRLELTGAFADLSSALLEVEGSAAHIHRAPAGMNGPIVVDIDVLESGDGRSGTLQLSHALTQEQRTELRSGLYYVNVHTEEHPGGELRAQLAPQQPVSQRFERALTGGEETPPITTSGTGSVVVVRAGNVLTIAGNFQDLSSDLIEIQGSPAHVHRGAVGASGPIVYNVEVEMGDDGRSGTIRSSRVLTAEELALFEAGELYLNIHSDAHPGGELRSQLRAARNNEGRPPTIGTARERRGSRMAGRSWGP